MQHYIFICLLLLMGFCRPLASHAAEGPPVRFLSYNILCDSCGGASWIHRKEPFFQTIKNFDPDVAALQEVSSNVLEEIENE